MLKDQEEIKHEQFEPNGAPLESDFSLEEILVSDSIILSSKDDDELDHDFAELK